MRRVFRGYRLMNNKKILLLCAVASLAACHGDANPDAQALSSPRVRTPVVKRGPTPEELTAGMVEAATIGKSTTPVTLKFDLSNKPVVGQPLLVVIAVMPQIFADPAILQVSGSAQLTVTSGAGPVVMPAVESTQVYRHNVNITPTADGVQLLSLAVSLAHDGVTETRVFSVPLIVAAAGDAAGAIGSSEKAADSIAAR